MITQESSGTVGPSSSSAISGAVILRRIVTLFFILVLAELIDNYSLPLHSSSSGRSINAISVPHEEPSYNYGLALSSCERYYKDIPKLLDDFAQRKPPSLPILVVVGGASATGITTHEASGAVIVNVTYQGFDVLALEWIVANQYRFGLTHFWFLFHDTVRFHEHFFQKLEMIAERCCNTKAGPVSLSLSQQKAMSMGLYSVEHLQVIRGILDDAMDSSGDIVQAKKRAIDLELNPLLFSENPMFWYLSRSFYQCIAEDYGSIRIIPDCNGAHLMLHYFVDVDITKVQQNYGQKGASTFNPINWPVLLPFIEGWRDGLRNQYQIEGAAEPPHLMCPTYDSSRGLTSI